MKKIKIDYNNKYYVVSNKVVKGIEWVKHDTFYEWYIEYMPRFDTKKDATEALLTRLNSELVLLKEHVIFQESLINKIQNEECIEI